MSTGLKEGIIKTFSSLTLAHLVHTAVTEQSFTMIYRVLTAISLNPSDG